jgi:ankyrin repeat protein
MIELKDKYADGNNSLHRAVLSGIGIAIRAMAAVNARNFIEKLNEKNENGDTPLALAIRNKEQEGCFGGDFVETVTHAGIEIVKAGIEAAQEKFLGKKPVPSKASQTVDSMREIILDISCNPNLVSADAAQRAQSNRNELQKQSDDLFVKHAKDLLTEMQR